MRSESGEIDRANRATVAQTAAGKTGRKPHLSVRHLIAETCSQWSADRASMLGAALAFYSFFSVGPLLLIVVVLSGWVYSGIGQAESKSEFRQQLQSYVDGETASTLEQLMNAASRSRAGKMATAIGVIGLLFSATGAVLALKVALNTIWGVMERPGGSWLWMVWDRLVALLVVLLVGGLLMLSSIMTAVLWSMAHLATRQFAFPIPLAQCINAIVSLIVVTLLFATLFKLLPDIQIAWGDLLGGAALTAILFLIGKHLFALYLSYVSIGSAYGTAGSLAILLLFNYYSAQVFFWGAEFTQVYAHQSGARVEPKRGAIYITEATRKKRAAARKLEPAQQPEAPDPRGKEAN